MIPHIARVGNDLAIEKDKLADLIVVNGNPLQDLKAAADVRLVIKNGRVFTQDEILAPARTKEQVEARRLALQAQERLCREQPHHCESEEGHAH
ncbi:hypothetical protein LK540_03725 [Massilia sp. IC2-278]|uniref:hypothetical protein n=1 Tax=Massilia sp. IC2-278 TaxID=2887200 RepID=UPI001E64E8BE|nr:hypothetical protein [Massilia sp. IC2-278]MCC2959535.1 hypothetical protein [Massilia sp. IC2-278]